MVNGEEAALDGLWLLKMWRHTLARIAPPQTVSKNEPGNNAMNVCLAMQEVEMTFTWQSEMGDTMEEAGPVNTET